jgi:hypothetical protein
MNARYAHIMQVEMIGKEGLTTLQKAYVAVLGVGNLGGELARHLVMLGVSTFLIDRDIVKEENLGTQGFTERDLGVADGSGINLFGRVAAYDPRREDSPCTSAHTAGRHCETLPGKNQGSGVPCGPRDRAQWPQRRHSPSRA